MFKRVLIANRGEIALRISRACRDLGISPVAVYSDADVRGLPVAYADAAYYIGASPARDSYLNKEQIIDVARKSGCEAIHPGYGFLSENAEFAEACEAAGLTFIGPPVSAIRLMGDKVTARRSMIEAQVPVVPGTDILTDHDLARRSALDLGLPIVVKAAAGGGGKGIRIVDSIDALDRALHLAATEALAAFGDSGIYVEKLLAPVRHIEVQIMADSHGNVVALGERECSIQRRHQKLIEESPSVAVTSELRQRLYDAAVSAARSVGYVNAGTIEFLLDREGSFYFLEMNTRLQVEHPVTELVTGCDLAVDQIRIAAGETLPYRQSDIALRGHAIECRITAEDPATNFSPSVGKVSALRQPAGPGIRVDSALVAGEEVSVYYDPMVAKLIAWGRGRDEAIRRLRRALAEYLVAGIHTTIPFHLQMLDDPRFLAGDMHTRFVDDDFTYHTHVSVNQESAIAMTAGVLLERLQQSTAPATAASMGARYWRAMARSKAQRDWSGGWQRSGA